MNIRVSPSPPKSFISKYSKVSDSQFEFLACWLFASNAAPTAVKYFIAGRFVAAVE